jgi:hypothetical protein
MYSDSDVQTMAELAWGLSINYDGSKEDRKKIEARIDYLFRFLRKEVKHQLKRAQADLDFENSVMEGDE